MSKKAIMNLKDFQGRSIPPDLPPDLPLPSTPDVSQQIWWFICSSYILFASWLLLGCD
ncbi:hypothetical protein ACS0TY_020237 [Phlomoides rotata]